MSRTPPSSSAALDWLLAELGRANGKPRRIAVFGAPGAGATPLLALLGRHSLEAGEEWLTRWLDVQRWARAVEQTAVELWAEERSEATPVSARMDEASHRRRLQRRLELAEDRHPAEPPRRRVWLIDRIDALRDAGVQRDLGTLLHELGDCVDVIAAGRAPEIGSLHSLGFKVRRLSPLARVDEVRQQLTSLTGSTERAGDVLAWIQSSPIAIQLSTNRWALEQYARAHDHAGATSGGGRAR